MTQISELISSQSLSQGGLIIVLSCVIGGFFLEINGLPNLFGDKVNNDFSPDFFPDGYPLIQPVVESNKVLYRLIP